MAIEYRPATVEEFPAYAWTVESGFGHQPTEEQIADWSRLFEPERSLAAYGDGEIVGAAGIFSFDLTLPGATTAPVAGVTAVAVRPTHRRRGILRELMARQLDHVAERGEALAILTASETSIYGRFGYGLATVQAAYEIQRRHAELAHPPGSGGRVRLVDPAAAAEVVPAVYDGARRGQPGALSRSATWWEVLLADRPAERHGASALFHVVHEADAGRPDGWAAYRIKGEWRHGMPDNELQIVDLHAADDEVAAALWAYCLAVDLVGVVSARHRPADDPIRWRLAQPRGLRCTYLGDFLWARVLDVPAALTARRYELADELVLEVHDEFRPATSGTYRLAAAPQGSTCARLSGSLPGADLALGIAELGTVLLGGIAPSNLARAGRIEERTTGALRRADRLFASEPRPWCATPF